jgi:Zn-finger nucleic acid-binding protein
MKRQSDDQWLGAARARYAAEGARWDVLPDFSPATERAPAEAGSNLRCPYCAEPSLLTPAKTCATPEGLLMCPRCYGVWARADVLAAGLHIDEDSPAVFTAVRAASRCRACFGRLDETETCRKCGKKLPAVDCPACAKPMTRLEQAGVTLDRCDTCKGTWFDTGEIAAVYGVEPPRGLAATAARMTPQQGDPSALAFGLEAGVRILSLFL